MSTTPAPEIDLRDSRLAELVAGLTGCDEHGALHALGRTTSTTTRSSGSPAPS